MDKLYFDIRSERLFREAEDCFYYFADSLGALTNLNTALELSPLAIKLLIFKGNILICEGDIELAVECFLKAKEVAPNDAKVLAGLANCYEFLGESEIALKYINMALSAIKNPLDKLYKTLYELKATILINLQQFELARKTLESARFNLFVSDLDELKAFKMPFIKDSIKSHTRPSRLNLRLV